ncbi:MAG: SDR family NAD(P)-dependent oxidoreductase [Wenzhouxiangella sp.]|nr:SDR family NAD(P)-dependent oxidoreductase [Wenzhouxiangella sp.]
MSRVSRPVWLVTGAAGGLGRALVARILAGEQDCIALDRNERGLNSLHDELAAAGQPPALYPLDLSGAGPDDYAEFAHVVEQQFGRLDVLVHAAAHFTALRPLEHQPGDDWFKTLQVGLTGPHLLNAAFMPLLRKGARGAIVLINNGACLDKPARWGAYGICQAGRRQMVASLASELGPRGPRAIEIDPGPFFSALRSAARPTVRPEELPSPASAAEQIFQTIQTGVT